MMARSIANAPKIGLIHWCKTQRPPLRGFPLATHRRSIHGVVRIDVRFNLNVSHDRDRGSMKQANTGEPQSLFLWRLPEEPPITASYPLEIFSLDPSASLAGMTGASPSP